MTHGDIYTKFMIEYDKANITSSYPSLTKYEVATILDKAYLALIAQKLTGNNPRRIAFEGDVKATEDIRPLIKDTELVSTKSQKINNEYIYQLPQEYLYYVSSMVNKYSNGKSVVKLVSHDLANLFKQTDSNFPWVKNPVCYIQGDTLNVLVDPFKYKDLNDGDLKLLLTYIKKPKKFAKGKGIGSQDELFDETQFELNDSMAEELINLAIIMSTEIAESSRLTTKINTRPLES